jgi:hypothetical protein
MLHIKKKKKKIAAKFCLDSIINDFQDTKERLSSILVGDWIENLNILRNNYFLYFVYIWLTLNGY